MSKRSTLATSALEIVEKSLARTSFWLLYAEEDRYRLLARNMTDVITRHGRDGSVLFASPAAESLFGCPIAELHEHGLFERVNVADRPAYLTALGEKRLAGDTARAATSDEVKDLRREATALKEVVADLTLENRLLKKSATADGEDEA